MEKGNIRNNNKWRIYQVHKKDYEVILPGVVNKMNCKKADKYLSALVDGELEGWWLRRALMKHLEKCLFCQKMAEIQKQIKHLLRTRVKHNHAPHELKMRIRRELYEAIRE